MMGNDPNGVVGAVIEDYVEPQRGAIYELRRLILDVANELPEIGPVAEELKWGQPSYSTPQTGSATPIRIAPFGADQVAVLVHCQTTLVDDMRAMFGPSLTYSKTRAVVLDPQEELPREELGVLIRNALTYHRR